MDASAARVVRREGLRSLVDSHKRYDLGKLTDDLCHCSAKRVVSIVRVPRMPARDTCNASKCDSQSVKHKISDLRKNYSLLSLKSASRLLSVAYICLYY